MLGAPPAFVLSQDQTLYKWYLSLKSVKSCFRSARNRLRPVWITFVWNCLPCFSNTNIGSVTSSFDIVQFSRSCAPQPRGWRLDYFTTEAVFCQALFFGIFWTFWTWTASCFSVLTGTFQRLLVLFKGFRLRFQKSFFCLSTWRSSIIPHPGSLVNTFWHLFSNFFAPQKIPLFFSYYNL